MNRITRTTVAGFAAGALLLAGCGSESDGGSDTDAGQEASSASFEIVDVWARTSPASADTGAAYFEITASEDDAIVGAEVSTDIAGTTEVHEVVMADGEMSDDEMSDSHNEDGMDMSDDEDMDMSEDGAGEDDMNETGDDAEGSDDMDMSEDGAGEDDMNMSGDDGDMDMGNMTMQEVASVDLPAGETVVFEPGGYHIMMLDLVEPLEEGDTFELTLFFESGAEETVTVEVREG